MIWFYFVSFLLRLLQASNIVLVTGSKSSGKSSVISTLTEVPVDSVQKYQAIPVNEGWSVLETEELSCHPPKNIRLALQANGIDFGMVKKVILTESLISSSNQVVLLMKELMTNFPTLTTDMVHVIYTCQDVDIFGRGPSRKAFCEGKEYGCTLFTNGSTNRDTLLNLFAGVSETESLRSEDFVEVKSYEEILDKLTCTSIGTVPTAVTEGMTISSSSSSPFEQYAFGELAIFLNRESRTAVLSHGSSVRIFQDSQYALSVEGSLPVSVCGSFGNFTCSCPVNVNKVEALSFESGTRTLITFY
jgi:hypothetical protein